MERNLELRGSERHDGVTSQCSVSRIAAGHLPKRQMQLISLARRQHFDRRSDLVNGAWAALQRSADAFVSQNPTGRRTKAAPVDGPLQVLPPERNRARDARSTDEERRREPESQQGWPGDPHM
jgi:hypothetical protein